MSQALARHAGADLQILQVGTIGNERPMRRGEAYREVGAEYLDKPEPERRTKELIEELV